MIGSCLFYFCSELIYSDTNFFVFVFVFFLIEKMAADILSDQFKHRLKLKTKIVGQDRINKAKEKDEDIAVLSMFIPGENSNFKCSRGSECLLGDVSSNAPGNLHFYLPTLTPNQSISLHI